MSLWSNGVDRICSLQKILMLFHGPNLCINCTSSTRFHRVSCSNEILPNTPKHYKTHTNMSLGSNGVDWVRSLQKFWCNFMARTSTLIAPVQHVLQRVSCSNETLPNALKHYETHQNMSLGSNGVDWVYSVRKILMRRHGTNFCINCTRSTRFALSFV